MRAPGTMAGTGIGRATALRLECEGTEVTDTIAFRVPDRTSPLIETTWHVNGGLWKE